MATRAVRLPPQRRPLADEPGAVRARRRRSARRAIGRHDARPSASTPRSSRSCASSAIDLSDRKPQLLTASSPSGLTSSSRWAAATSARTSPASATSTGTSPTRTRAAAATSPRATSRDEIAASSGRRRRRAGACGAGDQPERPSRRPIVFAVEHDAVAAARLRHVERAIGERQQLVGAGALVRSPRARRSASPLRARRRRRSRAALPRPPAGPARPRARRQVDAPQDRGELVAAEPRDHVGRAQAGAQRVAEARDHRVAGRVAERVVDRLEAVDVEQQQDAAAGSATTGRARAAARPRSGGG